MPEHMVRYISVSDRTREERVVIQGIYRGFQVKRFVFACLIYEEEKSTMPFIKAKKLADKLGRRMIFG